VHRGSKRAIDVVLLSADEQIFETTRNAIGEEHRVWRAYTAEEAIDKLVAGRCGVLVIDLGTSALEPVGLVRQVTQQFPDLVVVATGRRPTMPLLGSTISEDSRTVHARRRRTAPACPGYAIRRHASAAAVEHQQVLLPPDPASPRVGDATGMARRPRSALSWTGRVVQRPVEAPALSASRGRRPPEVLLPRRCRQAGR
jgi:hypothetical protein